MPLMPKRVKYRKAQRGKMKGYSKGALEISFGEYGLRALESVWITQRQMEAMRLTLARFLKKGGRIWFRIFPDRPVTKHPAESRMGKGKGDPDHWVAVTKAGRIIVELGGVSAADAKEALRLIQYKLPIPTKIVARDL
ncbi:MAG: 50S ribosomal protein L16 [Elusimicrobiota bacterium]